MSRFATAFVKYILPVVVLVVAGVVTARLIASREAPERSEPREKAAVVRTMLVHEKKHRLDVRASGTVEPAREVTIQPEVTGRIVDVHEDLQPGGIIREGETLVQIDRSDYRLAVEQRKTALQQAKSQLELEKGQQEIAKREWKLFKKEAEKLAEGANPELALRKPQLANAKAQVDAAKAQLEQARLNLRRTTVEAPFDALVRRESVSVGDLAGGQTRLATLVSTDAFWVRLKIPPAKIPFISIPNVNAEKGSKVQIEYDTGETTIERTGRVLRLVGGLDRAGRLARVIVRIDDPLKVDELDDPSELRGVPILLDSYVDARIIGEKKKSLIELPRSGVRNGDQVFVFADGKLEIRTLDIAWSRPDSVLVRAGLEDGERVVVGPMPNPLEGMPLRRADSERTAPSSDGENSAADESASPGSEPATPDAGEMR